MKRLSIIVLSIILAFYPSSVMATNVSTESDQDDNIIEIEDINEENEDVEIDLEGDEEALEDEVAGDDEATEEDVNANEVATDEADNENASEEEKATEGTLGTEEADETNAEEAESEEEATTDAEVEKDEVDEEDLDLTEIRGTARGDIEYDFSKGYYVLDLQAGLSNHSSKQVLTQKWIAFTLPDGVYVPDVNEVPKGIVQVGIDGKNALAIKIPDVGEFPDSKYIYPNIPLTGEDIDNDPNYNLYLLDVDVENQTYNVHGQIKNQRQIDFSVMSDTPNYDLDGSIIGDVSFNEDERHYVLDLNVNVTNNLDDDLTDVYSAFPLPADVAVLQSDLDLILLETEAGTTEVAFKLPNLPAGETVNETYQIPLIGETDAVVTSSVINLYKVTDTTYWELGQFDGSIDIDFSVMDVAWTFDAVAQIVKDYPGAEANQFGLYFAFDTHNLTIYDVDEVVVEFNVPETITVHSPDSYDSGNLDIEWDDNKAIISLDTVRGTQWNQGYFTALGESTEPLEALEGLDVTVTLFKDGTEVIDEINVPFEIVPYDGQPGFPEDPTPEDPQDPEIDKSDLEALVAEASSLNSEDYTEDSFAVLTAALENAQAVLDDENATQSEVDEAIEALQSAIDGLVEITEPEDPEDPQDPRPEDPEDPEDPQDPETPEDPEQPGDGDDEGEDGDDGDQRKDGDDEEDGKDDDGTGTDRGDGDGDRLPDTATNMFTYIVIGFILTLAGGALMLFRRKSIA